MVEMVVEAMKVAAVMYGLYVLGAIIIFLACWRAAIKK